jgi:hypothetical protein
MKLGVTIRRYVRFGLSSAALSRANPRWIGTWIVLSLGGLGAYIGALIEYVSASGSADIGVASSGKSGVVWLSIVGGIMASLGVGMIVVSRITPWMSSWFVQMPNTPVIPEVD